jgi:two-component system, sensor histidine kinase and response regulator
MPVFLRFSQASRIKAGPFINFLESDMNIHLLNKKSKERSKSEMATDDQNGFHTAADSDNTIMSNDLTALRREIRNLRSIVKQKDNEITELNDQNLHFLNSAAHDLRNPLGVIQMYCDFMRSEPEENYDESTREFIQIISSTGTQMQRIINNMLDYSKLESGRIALEKISVDTDHLLSKVITTNTQKAESHNIRIQLDPTSTGTVLHIDGQRIEQAMNNLVDNAIKFSQPGTVITVSSETADGGQYITVKDEGQGIPGDEQHKLFKPFSKTSVQPLNGESRTGLGLALVKTIIEKHKGSVGFESTAGKGSEFYFWLPV